jgi:hypothetical protein
MVAAMIGRALVIVAVLTASAHADNGVFAVEATVGVYDGFGAGVRVGDSHVGVHAILSWQPLIVTSQDNSKFPPEPNIDFYSSVQANADVYVLFSEPTTRSAVGASVGYKGSNILGHGAGVGFYATIDARERVSYFILAGLTWFPRGEDRLRDKKGYPADYDFTFPGPALNAGANVGIVFSP